MGWSSGCAGWQALGVGAALTKETVCCLSSAMEGRSGKKRREEDDTIEWEDIERLSIQGRVRRGARLICYD